MDSEKSWMSLEEFIGGWLGGIGGLVTSHPIDTVKVRQQNGKETVFQAIITTYQFDGLRGFYKGIGFPAMMAGIQNAIFFGVYANVNHLLLPSVHGQKPDNDMFRIMVSGNCAGLIQVLATTPVEIIKVRLQTESQIKKYKGKKHKRAIWRNMKYIYSTQGLGGFYRGFIPTAFRDVPTGGLYIGIYLYTNDFLEKHINPYWSHLLSGGLAGALSYAPVTPFDVVKTRIQADDPQNPRYKNMRDCVMKNYTKRGFRFFWRGFVPSSMRSFVCNSTIFVIYEICINFLM